MIHKQAIKTLGRQLEIDEIRITTAEPFTEASRKITEQQKAGLFLGTEHWYKEDIDCFCNVGSRVADAKSIVSACLCYLTDEKTDLTEPGRPHGLIARYTWRNHYLELRRRLKKIAHYLEKEYDASYCVYSNGPIAEKPIAIRSGIGYYGKHSIVINQTYGSWIVLGEIITDIEIEPDDPLTVDCGDCRKCIEACPTDAIISPYILDRRKCIQALTNWYGVIPDAIARVWGNRLYGCTICQDVCPKNKNVKPSRPRTNLGYVGQSLPLIDILQMDNRSYRQRYPNNQITANWIRFKAIKRNALIALGHIKDKTTLPLLKKFAQCEDEVFSRTAQWAVENFAHG